MTKEERNSNLPPGVDQHEVGSWRLIMALAVAGFAAGILLVSTFIFTDPMIRANKEAAMQRAIFKVLPHCTSYISLRLEDGALTELPGGIDPSNQSGEDAKRIYAGFNDSGELVGFAIPGSEPGFQDVIVSIFGYDGSRRTVIGFEVLESKETPGLGDKIFKDEYFTASFVGLATIPEIIPVKRGEKNLVNELETITGATISSKAIVRSLNKSVKEWQPAIEAYLENKSISIVSRNE
jgi:electron transport complex protein RnfG